MFITCKIETLQAGLRLTQAIIRLQPGNEEVDLSDALEQAVEAGFCSIDKDNGLVTMPYGVDEEDIVLLIEFTNRMVGKHGAAVVAILKDLLTEGKQVVEQIKARHDDDYALG